MDVIGWTKRGTRARALSCGTPQMALHTAVQWCAFFAMMVCVGSLGLLHDCIGMLYHTIREPISCELLQKRAESAAASVIRNGSN